MALTRTKGNGPYAPLGTNYYLDDAIMAAGEKAELLFCRSLAFSSNADADGFLTDRQVVAIAMGLSGIQQRVNALIREGLWERVDGGFQVRSWLKWNKAAEDIGRYRKKDRDRKAIGNGSDSDRNESGIESDSARLPRPTALNSTTRHITALPSETNLKGERSETLPAPRVTIPTRCSAHQDERIDPGPCGGCKSARIADEARKKREAAEAELLKTTCTMCHGSGWAEAEDGSISTRCFHGRAS